MNSGKVFLMDNLDRWEQTFTFAADRPFYDGHFPGDPITPGAHLIDFAARTISSIAKGVILSGRNIKFLESIRPEQQVTLIVERGRGIDRFTYRYEVNGVVSASGEMVVRCDEEKNE